MSAPRKAWPRHELRSWPRYLAQRTVRLHVQLPGDVHSCDIHDISLGGARLRFEKPVSHGREITIGHPDLEPLLVERLWQNGTVVGVQFDFSDESLTFVSHCLRAMLDLPRADIR